MKWPRSILRDRASVGLPAHVLGQKAELDQSRPDCAFLALMGVRHRCNGFTPEKLRTEPVIVFRAPRVAMPGGKPVLLFPAAAIPALRSVRTAHASAPACRSRGVTFR